MMMLVVIGVTRKVSDLTSSRQALRLTAVMVAAVSLLMVAHFAEIIVWSLGYAIVRVAPEGADLVYFAFVNYTTLGYGDIVPLERWRLLGPMTAMTGVLLFGWSNGVLPVIFTRFRRQACAPDRSGRADALWRTRRQK